MLFMIISDDIIWNKKSFFLTQFLFLITFNKRFIDNFNT
jgi:hypothetical protein